MSDKKVIIIDDEPLARSIVVEYLKRHPQLKVVAECNNGFEGVKAISQHKPDLVFLDIQMPKINGFEMLELLDGVPPIIFTTAFDEYAIRAFDNNAVDYLLKPFSQQRFDTSIEKWKKNGAAPEEIENLTESSGKHEMEGTRVVVRNNSDIAIVPVNDIHYIEAYDDYVKIFTKDNYYLKKKTMNHYEQVLDPAKFFRVHRSYIIHLQELTRIEPMEKNSYLAILKSGKKIPISRNAYTKLKDTLGI